VVRASSAAEGLCKWVRAVFRYNQVLKVVEPKRQALKEAVGVLTAAEKLLEMKKEQLAEITAITNAMIADLESVNGRKIMLEEQAANCLKRIERASKLIQGLGGEKERCVALRVHRCRCSRCRRLRRVTALTC
jgi:dynein heavy chain